MQVRDEKIKGFTLLELIVVVTLIGIVSAIGYPQFSEWRKDREVRGAVYEIKSLIEGINAQVSRGQYAFVQVHVKAGGGEDAASDEVDEDEVTQNGIVVTSKGMTATTLGNKLNTDDDFRNDNGRCNIEDTNYWDDDPSTGTKKIEVRQKSFENILTNWDGGSGVSSIGAVCFGKNETWFSAKEQLASGTNDVPDYYLFLCSAEAYEGQTNCDVTGGIPQKCNKYLYSIKWSRFGNISLSKFKFDTAKCKEDEVDGEWNEL